MPPSVHLHLTDLNHHLVPQSTLIRDSLTWYWETTLNASCNQLYPFDETSQLRQRRSKFDSLSTYLPCRSSSIFTNDIQCRPATIWTLVDFAPTPQPSSSSLSSKYFRQVALQVFTHGKQATLSLDVVREIHLAMTTGKQKYIMASIRKLYDSNQTLTIIGNKKLNQSMTELASTLTTSIRSVNDNLTKNVEINISVILT